MSEVTNEEREVMRHTVLGGQKRNMKRASQDDWRPGFYRNRFVTGEGSIDHSFCNSLVDKGLMNVKRNVEGFGGSDVFWLTNKGLDLADGMF